MIAVSKVRIGDKYLPFMAIPIFCDLGAPPARYCNN